MRGRGSSYRPPLGLALVYSLLSVSVCSPTLSTIELAEYKLTTFSPVVRDASGAPSDRGHRGGKAIGQPAPATPATLPPPFEASATFPLATGSDMGDEGPALQEDLERSVDYKKPSRPNAQMKLTTTTTSTTVTPSPEETDTTEVAVTIETEMETEAETAAPPQESAPNDDSNKTSGNITVPNESIDSNVTVVNNNNTVNNSAVKVAEEDTEQEPAKNHTVIVELSTARALLLETGVGRRAADSDVSKSQVSLGAGGLDAGAVSGICFGILVVLGLGGAISLVLYRRRYLNKPQTLNDKCSNPDSSGYIDDSTIRENSEEMYSLDNDSFLNSLEAMTIQNYWTDSVKHTKL